ncbi:MULTISPECIES: hypothetical protein [unclassified Halanaerobium]|uniref:hypothetical protein n=1 Tax=unclassified Halanaerobium TaxID=2641197 RepID=UPI0011C01FAF|nr:MULTISPECIES: hypothetical protein [unclassified Halanaerobium]
MNKRLFKRRLIYVLILVLTAGAIFSVNYYYGNKISQNLKNEIEKTAEENDYQIETAEITANPLLREINVGKLNLINADRGNLELDNINITTSWQQILYYIKNENFDLNKDFTVVIDRIYFANIRESFQLTAENVEADFEGEFAPEYFSDAEQFLVHDQNLNLTADRLKYNFPYYRSYGLVKENWEDISTFDNFKANYSFDAETKIMDINQLQLKNQFLDFAGSLHGKLIKLQNKNRVFFESLKTDYDLKLNGENLVINENPIYRDFKFSTLTASGEFDIFLEDRDNITYRPNSFDFTAELTDFYLTLTNEIREELKENTFGIFGSSEDFAFRIDNMFYEQDYNYPEGHTYSELNSPLIEAKLNAEYIYRGNNQPYLNSGILKFKPLTDKAAGIVNILEMLYGKKLNRDKDGYITIEAWGDMGNLQFK